MCFSATASFVTAAATGAVGVAALARVSRARDLPPAATCLFFALQQSIEGLLWLDLPLAPDGAMARGLIFLYLFFAEAFWPVYAPLAALGAIVLVGSAVARALYWEAFISVWCFFAAAASLVILWHFEASRRQRLLAAGA